VRGLREFAEGKDSHERFDAYSKHLGEVPENPYEEASEEQKPGDAEGWA